MRDVRGVVGTVALFAASTLLAGCDTTAQFAPSLTRVVGLQTVDHSLSILTGAPCRDVTRIVVLFRGDGDIPSSRTQLTAETPTTVDQLVVGGEASAAGFTTSEPLPAGFDWRDHTEMDISFDGPAGDLGGATSVLEPVERRGLRHAGDGTAYIRDEGWLTPKQIASGDTKTFLTACTPDPEQGQR